MISKNTNRKRYFCNGSKSKGTHKTFPITLLQQMPGLFYRTVKHICTFSLKFYFRKWQVSGLENLPAGPVIFVPNHRNAFLDAVIVACSSEKNPWFMTRAQSFE